MQIIFFSRRSKLSTYFLKYQVVIPESAEGGYPESRRLNLVSNQSLGTRINRGTLVDFVDFQANATLFLDIIYLFVQ